MTERATKAVTGRLMWIGQVISCRECDAADQWTLLVEQPPEIIGELAWMVCENGHRARHPLVYPEIVRQVAEWQDAPELYASPVGQSAGLRDWYPRWISWQHTGGLFSGKAPRVVYRPWTEPGPVDWERDWPQVWAGKQLRDAIAEWARTTPNTDMSLMWMSCWGTTDPDKRHIALAPGWTQAPWPGRAPRPAEAGQR